MHFANTGYFHFFWIVIAFAVFLWWAKRNKQDKLKQFAGQLFEQIAATFNVKKQVAKNIILINACVFAVIALARPQWGYRLQEVKRQGLDIIIAIDVSKSMLAQDVAPNRLERTKLAVRDLLSRLKGDRIGLLAFSGEAFMFCPLTTDYGGFLLSLNNLNVDIIPRGGTAVGSAINEAIKGYDNTPNEFKTVIFITDGENLEGDPIKYAKLAKQKGIKIYCLGIGSPQGELIRLQNERGEYGFLKDQEGNFVKSRLNERLLQEVALTTGGIYVRAGGAEFGLDLIYDNHLAKLEKREIESKTEKRFIDRFQIPLGFSLILLVIESVLSTRKEE